MKKQKITLVASISLSVFLLLVFASQVHAAGSATVSWTPPTTDAGGGALTGLTGYKIYYDTASHWATSCSSGAGLTPVAVSGGAVTSYRFNNTLTPGQTYYFAVVATDGTNLSGCATGTGGVTEVSKLVSYSGDINTTGSSNHRVDIFDYNTLKAYFGTTNAAGDVNKDGTVNIFDYNILKADFGFSF